MAENINRIKQSLRPLNNKLFNPLFIAVAALLLTLTGCAEYMNLRLQTQQQQVHIQELEKKCKQYEERYYNMVNSVIEREEGYKKNIANLEREVESLNKEKADMEQSLTDANQELRQALQTQTANAQKREQELNEIVNALKTADKQKNGKVDSLISELAKLKQDCQKINGQLDNEKQRCITLSQQLDTAKEEQEKAEAQLKQKDGEIAALKDKLNSSDATTNELRDNIKALEQKLANQAMEAGQVAALQKQVKDLKQQLQSLEKTGGKPDPALGEIQAELENALSAAIQANTVWLEDHKQGLAISILSDELFEPGTVILATKAKSLIEQIAGVIKKYPERQILIEGHTDNQPLDKLPFYDNWALASARANNVVRFFVEDLDMNGKQFKAASGSQYHPVASNSDAEGRKKNRRVTIVITRNP